jgi:hypothetical protein
MSNVIFSRFERWSLKTYYAPNHCWVKFWPLVDTRETPEKVRLQLLKQSSPSTRNPNFKQRLLQYPAAPIFTPTEVINALRGWDWINALSMQRLVAIPLHGKNNMDSRSTRRRDKPVRIRYAYKASCGDPRRLSSLCHADALQSRLPSSHICCHSDSH